jgi:hypothetical protein
VSEAFAQPLVPILLGGARLFDSLGEPKPPLRQVHVVEAPGVTYADGRPGQPGGTEEGR